ncbi:putative tetratricopeptide-like helical domain superfamily, DYW domain-containing protein [Helianthus annuus]|uniref:Tetratricopeptide-like helical domain superfamily, DYW domain-containing protein n=1 Tax=Helianthus annuus TaxID=4232 RepID=A0A9K3NN84_HELAN|nr:pentatricopeptide repeat-containing protein At3g26782, mitochondrial-like [Helianthus annuus]KAF5806554.1 putative tetratricopeptide-like helical domain superfamily, DYW domain-containing protein [Helianthus annuus]KAJ0570815.1 putative tetratricopeptide-like helical domain superfamily, DYW domain-containing protein [Helianthus annuus]KAJ0577771.1 putative tetratricopeptide-like helical domain superfamily, DYW domain-containing protein [Helianthus annuus]KAJ0585153.1 putative tetratricopepti
MIRWGLTLRKNNPINKIEHHYDKIIQSCNTLQILTQIHSILTTTGIIKQSVHLTARIIIKYSNFLHLQTARHVFDSTDHDTSSFLWNTMLRAYANSGFSSDALEFYSLMRKADFTPNNYTFPFVLKSCAASLLITHGKLVHSEVLRTGFGSDVYVEAALVDMYAGCGIIDDARKVFDKMSKRDVVCWTAMITAYEQAERAETALCLLDQMQQEGFVMDWVATVTVASAVGQLGDAKRGRAVHGYAVRNGLLYEVPVVNSVLAMYAKCGEVEFADMIFERAEERNVITWNSMLTCYVQNGLASEALDLFERMKTSDVNLNQVTVLIVVSACSYLGSRQQAAKIHDFIVQNKIDINQTLRNAIMDMYAKCADLDTALKMFKEIPVNQLDVSAWNTLIAGYGMHGYGKHALNVFNQMKDENFQPNHITFTSVLSACSHSGLVNEGKKCFAEMEIFSVAKEPKHYACMVDMYGRAGLLNEAYELIKDMKSHANDEVWGALLLACKIHGNTNLAEVAADNLFHLEPQHTGYYVLMSNIYADSRNWQEVGNLRRDMKNKGLRKPAAVSLIEVNNELYGFRTGEHMDSFTRNVYQKVERVVVELKMEGYVPDLSCVFHDVEDEDKHGMLNYHGEKLALAFGLMNVDAGLPIFINKNLRVCSDCHSVFKLVSRVYGRKIVVRDVNRFHHFEDGLCSCNDYW